MPELEGHSRLGTIRPTYTYSTLSESLGTRAKYTGDRRRSSSAPSAPPVGASPAPRAVVPFHHEDPSLWPYPRAPLDDRDDIVELDFADTSALSDVDAFERRRQNGKNGAKLSKMD